MGNDHGSGKLGNFSASFVGSGEVSKVFKPWEDARKRTSFLRNFEVRSDAGPGQAAAGSAAAFAQLGNQVGMQAAAALVDLGDLVGAGPAAKGTWDGLLLRLIVSSLLMLRTMRMLQFSPGTLDGLVPRLRVPSFLILCRVCRFRWVWVRTLRLRVPAVLVPRLRVTSCSMLCMVRRIRRV